MESKENNDLKNKKKNDPKPEISKSKVSKKKKQKSRERRQLYVPLASMLAIILPSFRTKSAEAAESEQDSSVSSSQGETELHHQQDQLKTQPTTELVGSSVPQPSDSTVSEVSNSTQALRNHYHHTPVHLGGVNIQALSLALGHSQVVGATSNVPTHQTVSSYLPEVIEGKYGTLTIKPDGTYTYELNHKSPAYIALQGKEPAVDHFVVDTTDGRHIAIGVPVTGSNETPTVTGDVSGGVTEDLNVNNQGLLTVGGQIDVADQDHDESALQPETIQGKYGSLTIDSHGHWQYSVDNSQAVVQALTSGSSLQETIVVHTTDGTAQPIQLVIDGTDDNAFISGGDTGSTTEDLTLQTSGQLTVVDPDAGQDHFVAGDIVGAFGALHLNEDGSWTYNLDNKNPAVQSLGQGATATDVITVQSADGTAHQVTITINGTNDLPKISGSTSGAVVESGANNAGVPEAVGQLTTTDPDTGDTLTWAVTQGQGKYGSLTIDQNGQWQYQLDNNNSATDALSEGQQVQETFTVTATDSSGNPVQQIVTVGVTGSNDLPVISGTATGAVVEAGAANAGAPGAQGQLSATDPDTGDTLTWAVTQGQGTYGSLTIDQNGQWHYQLDNNSPATDALSEGQQVQETFTVTATDSSGNPVQQTVTVGVTGSNDLPVISGTATGAVVEAGAANAGAPGAQGQLSATDPDTGDTLTWAVTQGQGTYGSLTIDQNGQWHYQLDNNSPATDALSEGQQVQETFTVTATDSSGNPVQQTVTVGVTGSNDLPVISGTATGAVVEAGTANAGVPGALGQLWATDPDTGDTLTWAVTQGQGTYGSLTIDQNGQWQYQLDNHNPATDALSEGQQVQETFTVTATDSSGNPVQQTVTVGVTGSNDLPVISGTATGAVVEAGAANTGVPDAVGQLTSSDPDTGDTLTWAVTQGQGSYGSLTIDQNGQWQYQLDNNNPATDALSEGQQVQETFIVTATDSSGNPVQQTVTVGVTGSNDLPVISGTATGAVVEAGAANAGVPGAQGQLSATDPDTGDTLTWAVTQGQGTYGSLTIDQNGQWHYQLDNNSPATDALSAGQQVQETFTVTATDSSGNPVQQTVTVGVTGSNDLPVISGTATGAVVEAGAANAGVPDAVGQLTSTDPDTGDTLTWAVTQGQGSYGSLTIDQNGQWQYQLDNNNPATDALSEGQQVQETFTVTATDSSGNPVQQTVTVGVTGSNDLPVISGTATGAVVEAGAANAGVPDAVGQLTSSDPDTGDTLTWAVTQGQGSYGSLTIDQNGQWHYQLDNNSPATDALSEGQQVQETFTVTATDSSGNPVQQTVTVGVTGSNDLPVISGTATGAVVEAGTANAGVPGAQGQLSATDPDTGDTLTWAVTQGQGTYGSLRIDQNGQWQYQLDNHNPATDALSEGQQVQETFTVTATDSSGNPVQQTVTVGVTGSNDLPVISGTATGAVVEAGAANAGAPGAQGQLSATDPDTGDTLTWAVTQGQGTYGSLTIDQNGQWQYQLDNNSPATDALSEGQQVQETFTVTATDSSGNPVQQTVTVGVTGSNDLPVISGTATGAVVEAGTANAGVPGAQGQLSATDPDTGDTLTWAVTQGQGSYGSLTIDQNGQWQYQLDNHNPATDALSEGQQVQETFTVTATDSSGNPVQQIVTVGVTGSNDLPVISGTATGAVVEAGAANAGAPGAQGQLSATDPDTGDTLTWAVTQGQGTYGSLTIDQNGQWHYQLDNNNPATDALSKGQQAQETFTVTATDSLGNPVQQTVTVGVTGSNDLPVISGTATGAVVEAGAANAGVPGATGTLTTTDPDTGDTLTWAVTQGQGTYGSLTIDQNGQWQYQLDNNNPATDALSAGQQVQETFTVTATDSSGNPVQQTVTVGVTGSNDLPVISGTATGAVVEAGAANAGVPGAQGQLLATDPDTGDTLTWAVTQGQGSYGSLTIDQNGQWQYQLDNNNSATDALSEGQQVQETFTVTATDSSGNPVQQTVTVGVTGSNDLPVISGTATGAVVEAGAANAGVPDAVGQLTSSDPDTGDTLTWAVTQGQGSYGSLTIDQNGQWHYQLDNNSPATDALSEGQQVQETFTVTATDSSGNPVQQTVTVGVTGTNDKPIVSAWTQLANGVEDKAVTIKASDLLTHATDVDTGDMLSVSNLQATHGTIVDNHNGTFTFTPDKDYNGDVRLTYRVEDGHGGAVDTQARLNLAASPDNAVITDAQPNVDVRGVTEDRGYIDTHYQLHYDGKLNIQDPDAGEAQFDPNIGSQTYQGIGYDTKLGGHVLLMQDGRYTYTLDNRNIQNLAEGETKVDSAVIRSADGTTYTMEFSVHGTNDAPTITAQSHSVTEGGALLQGQMQGHDIDTGAVLTYSTPTIDGLTFNQDGSYTFDPSHATYQSIPAGVTKTLTIPVTVTDDHHASSTQPLTITITGANNAAVISGVDTGSVTEDHNVHASVQGNYSYKIEAQGTLTATDPDAGESGFDYRTLITATTHPEWAPYHSKLGGELAIDQHGNWNYYIDNRKPEVQNLGAGETLTDTVTIHSKDGTPHVITITINGTNDKPVVSSEVTLTSGTEDADLTFSAHDLLANATDIDANDAGQLTVENLQANHGSIVDNKDGTYTFSPDKDYSGQVHFTYDVTDAHGGVTHTGASTTLTAVNDASTLASSMSATSVTEDHTRASSNTELWSGWNNLDIKDIDSVADAKVVQIEINGVTHTVPADFAMNLPGDHGTFNFTHSTDGHDKWSYTADNSHSEIQGLSSGESLTDTLTLITADGTRIPLTATIQGTDDHVIIDTPDALTAALGVAVEDKTTIISGTLLAHDADSKDSVTFTSGDTVGTYGTLHVDANGQWHYDLDHSKANVLQQGETKAEGFDITATSTDGSTATKHIEVLVQGSNDKATISVTSNPDVYEDGSSKPVEMVSGKLNVMDPDHDQSGFSLDVGKRHDPFNTGVHGGLHISKDGSWTYTVNNSQIQQLAAGQEEHVQYNVHTVGGDYHVIDIKIVGTNDAPVLSVTQTTPTTGTLTETDVDVNDTHTFSVVSSTGQFGSLTVDPDSGAYVYTANGSVAGMSYDSATQTYHGTDVFEVKVIDHHGGESSKFITFDANGHVSLIPGQQPTISTTVPVNPLVTATQPSLPAGTNTPPNNAVTVDLAASSDTGLSDTDNLTKDASPTITGHTDIPYSQVTIYDGSTPVGHAVSDGSGQYSVAVSSLSNGDHNLSAKALAPSSVLPATSSLLSVHVDTDVAPLQVSLTHDTGSNASDLITSDGSLTITGQEAGAVVEYSVDGGHTWSSTFTPQAGSNTVDVRQTDTAGNVSASTSLTFTLDNTATAPSVSLTSDSGRSSSDKITNVGDMNIGNIEQGATVEYSIDNGVHWSTQFTPNEGVNNVQVRQTDVAGNVSPSTSLTYTLDTQTDIRVNSAQVDQHGQGMMVQVYLPKDSEVTLLEITSDGGGTPLVVDLKTVQRQGIGTSVSHPDHQYQEFVGIDLSSLPDGNLTIRVAGIDAAGNTVTAQSSANSNYVLDTTASVSDDSNTAVEDSTAPVSGNLLSNDADATTVTTTGDIQGHYGIFHLSSDGSYTYTLNNQLSVIQQLDSTSSPLVDSIAYTASDNHGNQATAHLAISIQGTDDNHAPVVTSQTVSTDEDSTHTFTTAEFGYADQDGDALHFITISQLPAHGLLLLNGKAVTTNQQITKADLDAGHLTFAPINNENGANYAQFTFTANDGHQNSASASMILNVNAVNDAPTVGSSFFSSLEDQPYSFTAADFKYSDIDGDALNHITITNVAHGVLTLNGVPVNVGDNVSASDVSSLVFTPTPNYFSAGINGLGAVQFTANDGYADSKEGSIFINIANAADPASFSGDSTGQAQEDNILQASGTLTANDPDGTVGFIAVQGGVGIVGSKGYGHAHIDSNGHWTYDLYNHHPIVQQLAKGQTETETITVQSADGTQHDIVITITGTNDLPTVSEKPQAGITTGTHTVTEDSGVPVSGQLVIDDIDGDATSVIVDPHHTASFGHVQYDNHSNTWVYNLDNNNATVEALNDGDTLTDRFTLLVDDGHGGTVSKEIVMTINGHTDPVPYTPPTISVTVDTRHAHHITAGITASTVRAYAQSIGQHATTVSGSHEIKGHGHSDIIIVNGRLHEEAELESGNDILFLGGRLTDEEIEGGHGSDTLILGAYNRNNAPRLHDHGEKISDGHEEMELESIENIILGDGTVLKGHLPPNFPSVTHDHYEVPVNIQAHLSSSDESVSSIRLTHLQQGLTLQSNGHNIHANQDGSYTVPANGHLVVISSHPISSGHHYFETEVTTHNTVTGVTAVTTEDLQGHIQSHVNPPPPPPPPVAADEPMPDIESVNLDSADDVQHDLLQGLSELASAQHDPKGADAYLDMVGIHAAPPPAPVPDADLDLVLNSEAEVVLNEQGIPMDDTVIADATTDEHKLKEEDDHHHHNDLFNHDDIGDQHS